MGWTPQMVGECSPWEFSQAVNGYIEANNPDPKPPPPTEEQHAALMEKYS